MPNYIDAILAYYKEIKNTGDISPHLLNPTPGSIREECLLVCKKRPNKKDDEILSMFFLDADPEKGYVKRIENSKASKYKQLPKILAGKITNPGTKHLELIAWLLDFKPRPSTAFYMSFYSPTDFETKTEPIEEDNNKIEAPVDIVEDVVTVPKERSNNEEKDRKKEEIVPKTWKSKLKENKTSIIGSLIGLLILGGFGMSYLIARKNNQQCMYWTGDQYELISCNDKAGEAPIIAADSLKIAQLKRITQPDTLTSYAIGRVWYAKVNGHVEFYTAGGEHPTDKNKRLLPITPYMLNKYVFSKDSYNK